MIIVYSNKFLKSIEKLRDCTVKERFLKTIENIESAKDLTAIPNIKSLSNRSDLYRLRIGDYRLIFSYKRGAIEIILLRFVKRDENTY